jgi:O-antigen/teichoic acid export membrane protein
MSSEEPRPGPVGEIDRAGSPGDSGAPQASRSEPDPSNAATEEETMSTDVLDTSAAGGLIIRGGAYRIGGYVGVMALSLIPLVLLTRHLGTVRFSEYTTVISLVTLVSMITDVGMSNLATREYAVHTGAERDELMRDLLGLRVTLTLLGVLAATLFAVAVGYDSALLAGTVAAGLATVMLVFQHTLCIPLAAELRLGALSLLDLLRQALTVVAIVVLIALNAGLFPLLAVTLVVYLLLMPVTMALMRGQISLRMELRPRRWLSLLRLTVAFSLAMAVGTIYVYTSQILTSLVASPHQSGLFAVAFRVFMVLATVPGLLVSSALPLLARTARDDHERLGYAMQRIFEVSLILGVATAVGLLGGAQFAVRAIAGPKFAGADSALQIEGVALAASFLVAGWSFALISLKRYRGLLYVNAAGLVVSFTLTLTLAPTHGASGAALATLCGELTLAVGLLAVLLHEHPELRPRATVLPKVLLAGIPALAVALLPNISSLARALAALALYGLLIVLTRAVPEEIVELIPRPRR